jgi:hypothetical protein
VRSGHVQSINSSLLLPNTCTGLYAEPVYTSLQSGPSHYGVYWVLFFTTVPGEWHHPKHKHTHLHTYTHTHAHTPTHMLLPLLPTPPSRPPFFLLPWAKVFYLHSNSRLPRLRFPGRGPIACTRCEGSIEASNPFTSASACGQFASRSHPQPQHQSAQSHASARAHRRIRHGNILYIHNPTMKCWLLCRYRIRVGPSIPPRLELALPTYIVTRYIYALIAFCPLLRAAGAIALRGEQNRAPGCPRQRAPASPLLSLS